MQQEKLRLFIGSFTDQSMLSDIDIGRIEKSFGYSLKWVEKSNFHLTWKFIGDIHNEKLESLESLIGESCNNSEDIRITFDSLALWPNYKWPKQMVITGKDIDNNGSNFYKSLNTQLAKAGIEKEKRPFNPHITIGRFKIKEKPENKLIFPDWLKFSPVEVKINQICLIKSILTPKGSIYEIIKTFSIA